jgi:hypothetical protein
LKIQTLTKNFQISWGRCARQRHEVLFLLAGIAGLVVLSTGIAIATFR